MEAFAGVSTNKSRQAAIVLQRVTLTPPQRPAACRNGEGARGRKRTRVTSPRSCAFPSRLVCDVDVVSSLAATCFAKPRESLVKLRRTRDPGECLVTATSGAFFLLSTIIHGIRTLYCPIVVGWRLILFRALLAAAAGAHHIPQACVASFHDGHPKAGTCGSWAEGFLCLVLHESLPVSPAGSQISVPRFASGKT
ncbi:uncharacterized protein LOC105300352 isoform X2 [Pteropus vampyrus]|uniref:Uncharacterized protein LOC105300352 isoform X2 n=1 Tax=Pteropus vampyrus TaxID=132908 RepID=A0A6P6D2M2_PTEVA|nr:uncharacterized protein LOC105300352 isoform X2 [Pteropus vampyrus]